MQSVGQALFEETVYDEQGQLITGEFTDYAIPRASDIPHLVTDRTVTPSPVNPMGVKGVGEAGTIGATPALVNALVDALSPLGMTPRRLAAEARKNLATNSQSKQRRHPQTKLIPTGFVGALLAAPAATKADPEHTRTWRTK